MVSQSGEFWEELDERLDDSADVRDDNESGEDNLDDTMTLQAATKSTDNVGEASVEIDVESLVAEFEAEASDGVDESGRIRRRLDAILERKRRHEDMADFEDYELE